MALGTTKFCRKCATEKPLSEFGRHKRSGDGLQAFCKICHNLASVAWSKAHPDKKSVSSLAWRSKNIERCKETGAAWLARNRERKNAVTREWNKNNPARYKEYQSAWWNKNKDLGRIYQQNRRLRKLSSGVGLSQGLATKLYKLQRGMCACCGERLGRDFQLDHIVPVALGGAHADINIQLLLPKCNRQKSAKYPTDFMQSRGFLL